MILGATSARRSLRMFEFDEVDSTLLEAQRLISSGLTQPFLVSAGSQTQGRGRHGRAWASPPGNVYWTLALPRQSEWPRDFGLTFAAALAAIDAIVEVGFESERLSLKWPNDVLVDGRKVAGALVLDASAGNAFASGVGFVLVGIGINLVSFPDNAYYEATSLQASGATGLRMETLRDALTKNYLARLEVWERSGFGGLRDDFMTRLSSVGRTIRVGVDPGRQDVIEGVNRGIDASGALRIELPSGEIRVLHSADVLRSS